jgi:hypothetical protein
MDWGTWKSFPPGYFRFTAWNEYYEGNLGNYAPNEGYF